MDSPLFLFDSGDEIIRPEHVFEGRYAWEGGETRHRCIFHNRFGWVPPLEFFSHWLIEQEHRTRGGE